MKRLIFCILTLTLLGMGYSEAASKGNAGQKYLGYQKTLSILQKMGIGQGNEISYVKSSPTGDREWRTHLFSVKQGDTSLPLITYVNSRDVVVGILIRDGSLVAPKMPVDDIQPKIDISKSKLTQDKRMAFNASAKEVIYMFTDHESSYCKAVEDALPVYSGKYKVIVKHFPLEQLHPGAKEKAIERQCLAMAKPCYDEARQIAAQIVEEDIREGTAIGVDGVPFFITQSGSVMRHIPDLSKPPRK